MKILLRTLTIIVSLMVASINGVNGMESDNPSDKEDIKQTKDNLSDIKKKDLITNEESGNYVQVFYVTNYHRFISSKKYNKGYDVVKVDGANTSDDNISKELYGLLFSKELAKKSNFYRTIYTKAEVEDMENVFYEKKNKDIKKEFQQKKELWKQYTLVDMGNNGYLKLEINN